MGKEYAHLRLDWRYVGLTVIITLVAHAVISSRRRRHYDDAFASRHGCQPPRGLKYNWPLGLDLILKAFQAEKAGQLLRFFMPFVEDIGHTFEQVLLGTRGIDTNEPRNIEAILSTQFEEFGLGARSRNFRPFLGHGIFTQDGAAWKRSRELLRPQFMHNRTQYFAEIQDQAEKLVRLTIQSAANGPVDLQLFFFRFTLDTTTAALFGRSVNSLESEDPDGVLFAEAFSEGQAWLAKRGRIGDFYWLLGGSDFKRCCKTVHSIVDKMISEALKGGEIPSAEANPVAPKADRYIFLQALMAQSRDPIALRDQLINILLAGRDTTACLLAWTFRLLALHPEIQLKLRRECTNAITPGQLPTRDDLKRMKYLSNVLHEVLRLYPSVPLNTRQALRTTTLPTGGGPECNAPVLVRKGEAVGYSPYAMHRRKDLYGDDSYDFRPERWEDQPADGPDLKNIGFGYLPFNGGPRVCLGQEFALLEASYATVRLLQTFNNIRLIDPAPAKVGLEKQHMTLVLRPAEDGCIVVMDRG